MLCRTSSSTSLLNLMLLDDSAGLELIILETDDLLLQILYCHVADLVDLLLVVVKLKLLPMMCICWNVAFVLSCYFCV